MATIHLTIERDREARSSHDGARFRIKAFADPGGPALLMSPRTCQSVTKAKSDAELLFGPLDWRELPPGEVRCSAVLEIDDGGEDHGTAVFGGQGHGGNAL